MGADGRKLRSRVASVRDEAVCVRQWDWSETSQTVSLFARETGMVRAVAKGSKRDGAAFSGGLEVLTRGEMLAIVKQGDAMAVLTAWDLMETFGVVRRRLGTFYAGMALADLVHHSVRDHDPHPALYDALLAALRHMERAGEDAGGLAARTGVLWFLWRALEETGHRPELGVNVRTGEPLAPAPTYGFTSRLGGLVASGARGEETGEVWAVRRATVELLRSLAASDSPAGVREDFTFEDRTRAARLLALHFRDAVGSGVPALAAYLKER